MARAAALPLLLIVGACHLVAGIEEATPITEDELCDGDAECDDGNPCTSDGCVDGSCDNTPLDGTAPEQVAGNCLVTECASGMATTLADDADLPDDGAPCTEDICVDGVPGHPPVAGGTLCEGGVCNGDGDCLECFSNAQCTTPDTCGGGGTPGACGCTPIPCSMVGLTCGFAADDGCGDTLNCNNAARDGTETDVDCGGMASTCSTRCNAGRSCNVGSDCASGTCDNGTCL